MRFSCALILSAALVVTGTAHLGALDTTHTVHRAAKTHLKTVHHRRRHAVARTSSHPVSHAATAHKAVVKSAHGHSTLRRTSLRVRHHRYYERFTASSFATPEEYVGDRTGGEDPMVRQAAIDALDNMNGTVVVINPDNGRILAMVNQKLALSPGAEPCSTIKLTVAIAALSEGIVTKDTMVRLPGFRMNMTQALAHSNNLYFEELGRELGFERVHHYATEFGLGELAGWHIAGEQLGAYPDHPIPTSQGGVGRMCSFGQGVSLTPLQLGAYVAALANGGTLYYLQHPTTPEEIADFTPHIKRKLDIARFVPEMEDGMAGAVEFGTARRLRASFTEFPVFGKTGTCSDKGTRFGWFASFEDSPQGRLVAVFFLEGGRPTFGPRAAELAGLFYRNLQDHDYFADRPSQTTASDSPGATLQQVSVAADK
ncbi:MAG: penicillin-binding transpeptidase domain-containing protein [Acidobacteriota bacterium]